MWEAVRDKSQWEGTIHDSVYDAYHKCALFALLLLIIVNVTHI